MQERRIRADAVPRHVAIIMDGNGRWAERRGQSRIQGHIIRAIVAVTARPFDMDQVKLALGQAQDLGQRAAKSSRSPSSNRRARP